MRLTRGEAWWLLRRRAGYTQDVWAVKLGLTVTEVRAWELDRAPAPAPSRRWRLCDDLTPGEFSAICRRRAGDSAERVSRWLDVSVTTLKRMERDRTRTAARLAAWWIANGVPRARAAVPVVVRGPAKSVRGSVYDRGGRPNGANP